MQGLIILVVVIALIGLALMQSSLGKYIIATGVIAIGGVVLSLITGIEFFWGLVKFCAIVIVVLIVAAILMKIFDL